MCVACCVVYHPKIMVKNNNLARLRSPVVYYPKIMVKYNIRKRMPAPVVYHP